MGKLDPLYIHEFKPTHQYTKEDFELLLKIIKPFKKIILTPHIIAELSNHIKNNANDRKLHYYFSVILNYLNNKDKVGECYIKFEEWQNKDIKLLCIFGFVDLSINELSKSKKIPILTDDVNLYNYLKDKTPIIKHSVIKYSHIFL